MCRNLSNMIPIPSIAVAANHTPELGEYTPLFLWRNQLPEDPDNESHQSVHVRCTFIMDFTTTIALNPDEWMPTISHL